jgi:hypothetical protein
LAKRLRQGKGAKHFYGWVKLLRSRDMTLSKVVVLAASRRQNGAEVEIAAERSDGGT